LNPLDEEEVGEMIDFRMRQAGYSGMNPLFTGDACRLVWRYTRGYPRKLALLCHNCLENLVMFDKKTVDEGVVRRVIEEQECDPVPE